MRKDYIIRKAQHKDIETIIDLLKVLFSIEEDFVFNKEKQRQGLQMMLEDGENRCILVAELEQRVIGMISGQTLVSTAEGGISVLVEDVVVDEIYRSQGVGRELLKAIEGWALQKGAKRLQLLADMNNSKAIEFYKSMNWIGTKLICLQKKDIG